MATEERRARPSIEDRLHKEWYRFSFFSAVYLLETLAPNKTALGTGSKPSKEAVRFSVKPGFAFPPSEIAGLTPGNDNSPAEMDVAFMGLIGPSGLLPHWYNSLASDRLRAKDSTLTAFFDLFHHRLLSLFYLAWKKHQFPVTFMPGASDKLSRYLLSLCGLGTPRLTGKIGFAEESLSFYSGLFSRRIPAESSLRSTIAHFTGTEAAIEQFVARTIPLEAGDITRLGQANSQLGYGILGEAVWECQTKFRAQLGPMSFAEYNRFIPSGDMHKPTFSLIRYMVGIEYDFEVSLCLKRTEPPPCILGSSAAGPQTRLGWSTWLKGADFVHQHDMRVTFQEATTPSH